MDSGAFYQLKDNQSRWPSVMLYLAIFLLAIVFLIYIVLALKVNIDTKKINDLDIKALLYNTPEQKKVEAKVLAYKKKIDDVSQIINNHKISLNIFNFIEKKTLPSVWFSNLSILEAKNNINLGGESDNMATLSNQIKVLEESKDYVIAISVLNSQITEQGKIKFTLSLTLNPKIFSY